MLCYMHATIQKSGVGKVFGKKHLMITKAAFLRLKYSASAILWSIIKMNTAKIYSN